MSECGKFLLPATGFVSFATLADISPCPCSAQVLQNHLHILATPFLATAKLTLSWPEPRHSPKMLSNGNHSFSHRLHWIDQAVWNCQYWGWFWDITSSLFYSILVKKPLPFMINTVYILPSYAKLSLAYAAIATTTHIHSAESPLLRSVQWRTPALKSWWAAAGFHELGGDFIPELYKILNKKALEQLLWSLHVWRYTKPCWN